ncbi:MAG: cobalamin biosynthesis protein [Deltaproteobacteria bacterium]|nr:cobalamin biosynthesis protein [Deltaproteobacteria bacterium]
MTNRPSSKIAVYALTMPGLLVAEKIARILPAELHVTARLISKTKAKALSFEGICRHLQNTFFKYQGHVIVAATGLVVRAVAPHLRDKKKDPAVVSLGQDGKYVISVLSGHLGGGNELARKVALITGGQPVINTATDISKKPAIEVVARDQGLDVENYGGLPAVARQLSEGSLVPTYDPHKLILPALGQWSESFPEIPREAAYDPQQPGYPQSPSLYVDYRTNECPPEALILRPQVLALGIGCHRGISFEDLFKFIEDVFTEWKISLKSVCVIASVETRTLEPALLELSRKWTIPFTTYPKVSLNEVSTPNPSETVKERIGVFSVCEAAAILAAQMGSLVVPKQKSKIATCAVALLNSISSA